MTIIEVITKVDAHKANTFTHDDKVAWLNELEQRIKQQIVDTHEGGENVSFTGYGEDTPDDTALIAPSPHDMMYEYWLEAKIDYANAEYDKYDNSYTMFNTAYTAFKNHYNRTHMPKGTSMRFF